MPKLILASSSKPRQALLKRLLIPFEAISPDVDETAHDNELPESLVQRLAVEKAQAIAPQHPGAIIIGADQVGVVDQKILGKPLNYANALTQLLSVSDKKVEFLIGLCVLNTEKQSHDVVLEKFSVYFQTLSTEKIKKYLRKEQPYHCAGSCDGDGLGIALIKKFVGDDYSALIGLPLIRLVSMLEHAGLDVLA